jgi:ferredoxin-NADP reductase/Na+-translocating ferredoxin:NAD+ oxidoreductase RnfD subunit
MFYYLLTLWVVSIILSLTNILPYNALDILYSGIFLSVVCNLANYLLAKIFHARTNLESAYITALILTLIVGPLSPIENLLILTFIGVVAMASKYVMALNKKDIFNPAAFAALLAAIVLQSGASWWIGSVYTLPLILLGGFLILTKIKRFEMVMGFLAVYFLTLILFGKGFTINSFVVPPVWFFVFVMLVEPLTSPSIKNKQVVYGSFMAVVYFLLPKIISGYAYGLETALLIGNLFNLAISSSFSVLLAFKKKEMVAKDTWQFHFEPISKFIFIPGQYLEWTFPHKNPDSRGTRRFFTVSSAPNEADVRLTMRVTEKGSSFKSAFMNFKKGQEIVASNPQGEFILPQDKALPLVFIAGGIGVTPFRSMIKSMLLNNEKRDIVLFYSNRQEADIAFKKILDSAKDFGVRIVYINTEKDGYVDEEMIKEKVPDYRKRIFYVSGPGRMIESIKKMLSKMKIKKIKTDFFPGYTEI